jgi:hypothetical protein
VGDLNAQTPIWNSAVSNPSGERLLSLFDANQFKISVPQCRTHHSHAGNGDVLEIVVHQIIRVSYIIVSDILDTDFLPIVFHILDHVKIRTLWEPIEKFTDWERSKPFATLEKAKPITGNIRGLYLAAVKHTTVQVSKTAMVAKATENRA